MSKGAGGRFTPAALLFGPSLAFLPFLKERSLMSDKSRRELAAVLAGGALAVGLASSAEAYQGNMERGLSSLYDALGSLREASSNKGGHRVKAINLIIQALAEVQAGIEYADETGGGGR
jgi:hypothetical protein